MKEVMVLRDPNKVKIIFNKWRGKILELLSQKPHTIKELANILKVNPGTVFHHIKILEHAELIEIIRTEMVGNIVMKFYQSVAREFRFDLLETKDTKIHSIIESKLKNIVNALSAYGIDIPDEKKNEIIKQIAEFWDLENKIKESIEVKTTIKNYPADIQREVFILISSIKLNENTDYTKKREELIKNLKKFEK
ncbi:MAG: ArsR/SmtB family transcription factor [Candidatus Helarchaeota archaeon]